MRCRVGHRRPAAGSKFVFQRQISFSSMAIGAALRLGGCTTHKPTREATSATTTSTTTTFTTTTSTTTTSGTSVIAADSGRPARSDTAPPPSKTPTTELSRAGRDDPSTQSRTVLSPYSGTVIVEKRRSIDDSVVSRAVITGSEATALAAAVDAAPWSAPQTYSCRTLTAGETYHWLDFPGQPGPVQITLDPYCGEALIFAPPHGTMALGFRNSIGDLVWQDVPQLFD